MSDANTTYSLDRVIERNGCTTSTTIGTYPSESAAVCEAKGLGQKCWVRGWVQDGGRRCISERKVGW